VTEAPALAASGPVAGAAADRHAARWAIAHDRLTAYLVAAGLSEAPAADTAGEIVERLAVVVRPDTAEEAVLLALEEARRLLGNRPPAGPAAGDGGVPPRVEPLSIPRQSLAPALGWRRGRWLPRPVLLDEPVPLEGGERGRKVAQDRTARRRRSLFIGLGLLTTAWSVVTFSQILAVNGLSALDLAHLVVFTVLVLWLSQSFWTLTAGFGVKLAQLAGWRRPLPEPPAGVERGRVAILMPVYNEDTGRVFAGLEAMWRDLQHASAGDRRFDLHVLSDTTDPDVWLAEIEAWRRLRAAVGDQSRIFYRRRDRNVGRKAGNIEDFVRRFGGAYACMLILDADSVMTGESMVELTRRMDANPDVGLIQAPPKLVRGRTLFARVLQCAGELFGPLAAAGLAFWARGEGNYWGHNAIIRVRPFSELCGLPQLPGRAPLGGQILSHDFVEAALMRRGGWQVWIAHDLGGSFEEPPPTIEDFAVRDRRWCQGNLQHVRVLLAGNLHWVSRLHLGIGVMSYVTSPLWLLFLILSALQAWEITTTSPLYFAEGWPFPILPVTVQTEAATLLAVTLGLLFVPKLMGVVLAAVDGPRRRALGGPLRLALSAVLETLWSALLAPVMMLLHTRFVLSILSGAAIDWVPQRRSAGESRIGPALRTFLVPTAIGVGAGWAAWSATPLLFYWLIPVLAGLVLSAPLAVIGASEVVGTALRRAGLLLVVEEREPPAVLTVLEHEPDAAAPALEGDLAPLVRVVLEPQANALHTQLLRAFGTGERLAEPARRMLERKAVFVGPSGLDRGERRALLEDAELMERLHVQAWLHWPSYLPEVLKALNRGVAVGPVPPAPDPAGRARDAA
jgi:membrane glycosyltransferase